MSKEKRRPTCCLRQLEAGPYQVPTVTLSLRPSDTDVITQYRLQNAKSESLSAQKNAKANIEFISYELQNVSEEAENLRKSIKDLEFLIASSRCKTIHPKKLSDWCKVKSSLRLDLSDVLQLEKRLQRELHTARITYRNAKIDDHIVNENIKKFRNKSWDYHSLEKSVLEQGRLEREIQSKKNAISSREETITSVANSITSHVLQKLPGEHNWTQKTLREARVAKENVSKYLVKSVRTNKEMKAVAQTETQLRQRRQAENLSMLKHEINEIKKTLAVKSHLKRMHDEEIAVEKEEVKGLLQAQGANPYLAEYLLAIEEKQRELQRKMLVEEQKRLLDMQREYATIEAAKAKEEANRKRWDQYWAKKTLDKLMENRKSQLEMFFDMSGPGDETHQQSEQIKTEIQDKIVEQLQERMSVGPHTILNHIPDDTDDNDDEEEAQQDGESAKWSLKPGSFVQEEGPVQFKPHRQSYKGSGSTPGKEKPAASSQPGSVSSGSAKHKSKVRNQRSVMVTEPESSSAATVEASLRKAVHLEESLKELLQRMAGAGENTKAILMNGRNVFDFGNVPVGKRKYIVVNVANIGVKPVQLKMSVLNPYGPFTFCNSLKKMPKDTYYSLRFKYQPADIYEESQETIKIEEQGKPENFFIIKLKGYAVGMLDEEEEGEE